MAQQSSFYNTDGTTRTYPSSKHIASKQHVAVYFQSATTSAWSIIEDGLYDLVNNSIVFSDAPDSVLYSQIEIRVADTAAELTDSPSDIALVAGAIGDISAIVPSLSDIATLTDNLAPLSEISASIVPNIAEILLADTNATTATTQADIATTQASIATTKASEASTSATLAEGYANSIDPLTIVHKDSDTGAMYMPYGTTAQRPSSPNTGYMRFNTDLGKAEVCNGSVWSGVCGGETGFKNYIINGNFDIWQRGTSQTSSDYGSDDRWYNGHQSSAKTHSRVTCTDTERALFNANYFSRTVVSSVSNAIGFATKRQTVEDVTRLAGKTVTISFWAKADANKKLWIEHKTLYGTGGTPSTPITGNNVQEFNLSNTWTKYQYTITLPSIVGKTLGTDGVHTSGTELQFWFDVGSSYTTRIPTGVQQSGTFDIAQVQLEEGSVATPFENRPYGLELSLCQRYYEIVYAQPFAGQTLIYDSNNFLVNFDYKIIKRITPTVSNLYPASQTLIVHRNYVYSVSCKCSSGDLIFSAISASAEL